jgi:hypothetical protein
MGFIGGLTVVFPCCVLLLPSVSSIRLKWWLSYWRVGGKAW